MTTASARDRLRWVLFAAAFLFYAAVALLSARTAGVGLSGLAVFFDGHLYLEIAKSFPLPYAPEALHYAGHAPGFPAAIYLGRVALPDGLLDWGRVALVCVFAVAAFSTVVFYDVCREMEIPALGGALLFAVANPQWLSLASTAHAEPLAVLFALLSLRAYLRDELALCALFLSLATLTRFPAILLGLPIAWGFLVERGRRDVRTLLWLGLPIGALLLLHVYLSLRIPGFVSVWDAHSVFWAPKLIPPFSGLVAWAKPGLWRTFLLLLTYGTVFVYLASLAVGLARRDGTMLALWVASILLFHVSLANSAPHLPRLVILAWPAALLLLWRAVALRVRPFALAAGCLCTGAYGVWVSQQMAVGAVALQRDREYIAEEIRLLDVDVSHWLDFERRLRRPPVPARASGD